MDWKLPACLLTVVVCLSGCSATSDDPRQGGLRGGLQGVYGGGYDKRLQERNERLASHQRLHQDLELESMTLTKEYQLADAKLAAEKQQMTDLEKGLQLLESQVAGQRSQSSRQQKEAAGIKSKIVQLQKKVREQHTAIDDLDRAGGSEANPEKYQTLQADRDRLGQEYKALQHQTTDPSAH
jgi:chromosome segregation ATPase